MLALGLANSGCSFIFVTPPPSHAEQAANRSAKCTSSAAAPIIDGIITGYQTFRTLYATQAPDSTYQGAPISRGADIGLGLGFTGLFLASTIYGALNTSECRRFQRRGEEQDRAEELERATRPPVAKIKASPDQQPKEPAPAPPAPLQAPNAAPQAPNAAPQAPNAAPQAPNAAPQAPSAAPQAPSAAPQAPSAAPQAPSAMPIAPPASSAKAAFPAP